jgi:hypothetical protein
MEWRLVLAVVLYVVALEEELVELFVAVLLAVPEVVLVVAKVGVDPEEAGAENEKISQHPPRRLWMPRWTSITLMVRPQKQI